MYLDGSHILTYHVQTVMVIFYFTELPTSPYNLGVTNIEARSVLLQFLPGFDGKTSITNWIVECLEGASTKWKKVYEESKPDATDLVVQNLHPYTEYRLRMIAVNVAGSSDPPSLPSRSFQTKQAAPSSPPGNVTARAFNETAIRISWTVRESDDRGENCFVYSCNASKIFDVV